MPALLQPQQPTKGGTLTDVITQPSAGPDLADHASSEATRGPSAGAPVSVLHDFTQGRGEPRAPYLADFTQGRGEPRAPPSSRLHARARREQTPLSVRLHARARRAQGPPSSRLRARARREQTPLSVRLHAGPRERSLSSCVGPDALGSSAGAERWVRLKIVVNRR